MRILAGCVIFLTITLSIPHRALSQELSSVDREKLKLAEKAADRFVERFRQTLDFGTVWKEFHMSDISCTIKANGFFSLNDYKRLKFEDVLLERFYVALMNYYYLKGVHDLSVARMDSDLSEEAMTPKEIRVAEKRSTYVKTNGKEPRNAKEIEEMIVELRRFARLYRKYIPRNVMRSAAWQANSRYIAGRGAWDHTGVLNGHPDFCVPNNVKLYIVERSIFYFYFVEESGRMRVAALGIGN
jgi:hypothetical protein